MSTERKNIIISGDGKTWHYADGDAKHEFLTMAGVEDAIQMIRSQLNLLEQNPGKSSREIANLRENIKLLEIQRQLAMEGGI